MLNLLRLGTGVLLLPLLLHLPTNDLGLYYVLIGLQTFVPLLDMGFLTSIERAVGYAMGGASDLKQQGVAEAAKADCSPNYALLWKLLGVTRHLYTWLTLLVVVGFGMGGTYVVGLRVSEVSAPAQAWMAWAITLFACGFEMYAGWWSVYLRALNKVLQYSQILVLAFLIKFVLSCGLLLAGAGLLSVPVASLVSSLVARWLARRQCLNFLAGHPNPAAGKVETGDTLRTLWPNSWRTALHYLSGYLTSMANTAFICPIFLGLLAVASYGLSMNIVLICQSVASVWVQVKWPLISQLRARNELATVRQTFRQRIWLAYVTYASMAGVALLLHQPMLEWLGSGKTVVPNPWFCLLLINGALDMHFALWSTLLATGNRAPFLIPSLTTSLGSLMITTGLISGTDFGIGALVVGPLVAGCAFNYWYWPRMAARSIESSWMRLTLLRG